MSILSALGRAVGDGLTLAAEVLCPRDHTAEDRLQTWESAAEAVEDEICDEAEACELSPEEAFGFFALGLDPADLTTKGRCPLAGAMCNCTGACLPDSSAAVSAAADPSPTIANTSPRVVGGEGSGGASDILQSAPPERSGDEWDPAKEVAALREAFASIGMEMRDDEEIAQRFRDLADALHPEADPGEVSPPSPGEQVDEDDLAAHIMGDFVSGQEVDPLTATLIDAMSSRIARCLLTDFHIANKK